ncbi:polyketide antibiotic transporter [Pseudonocardia sp. C8]|uniref:polyketide antibiotic transporter n=1 Tax=Pseudonocardia sp. C8 TaxID=2762759 RepID=UPI0016435EE8|nr:polyketide antibiotic transporter [Pseudonocardia sp. C8]MBC3193542.1 polyketide antibiotic transporter [Pseudonocardia sp. C8]
MSTVTGRPRATAVPASGTGPARSVARVAVRDVRRGGVAVVVASAGMTAAVVASYDAVVGQAPGGAAALAVLAGNPAIRTLFGEPVALDDPGGFAVWRTGVAVGVLVGVWAVLAVSVVLRGAEDAGRWNLMLAGRVRREVAVAVTGGVVAVFALAAGGAVGVAMVAAGATTRGAVLHGTGVGLTGLVFTGVGAVAAQVAGNRAGAAGAGIGVLLVTLMLRMVGDGVPELGWLRWLGPFGLTAMVAPFHADRVGPLAVLATAGVVLLVTAALLSGRRDTGSGLLAGRSVRRSRFLLLGSVPGFATRTALRPLAAWAAGIAAYYLLVGLLVVSATDFLAANPTFAELAARAGFAALGTPAGFAAALLALLPVPVGAFAARRIAVLAQDETEARLPLLLAGPLSRPWLLAGYLAVAAAGATALTVAGGLALWAGMAAAGAPLGVADVLAGAAVTVPISLLGAGFAALGLGVRPGMALPAGVLPGAGGFLWQVLADSVDAPAPVRAMSPFAHLSAVPAEPADPRAAAVTTVVALVAAAVGAAGYRRRDLNASGS